MCVWSVSEGMEEQISFALIGILAVGTMAMLALLSCYICVFRQLCCSPPPQTKRRRFGSALEGDLQMGDTTQNVEISIATATETDPSRTT